MTDIVWTLDKFHERMELRYPFSIVISKDEEEFFEINNYYPKLCAIEFLNRDWRLINPFLLKILINLHNYLIFRYKPEPMMNLKINTYTSYNHIISVESLYIMSLNKLFDINHNFNEKLFQESKNESRDIIKNSIFKQIEYEYINNKIKVCQQCTAYITDNIRMYDNTYKGVCIIYKKCSKCHMILDFHNIPLHIPCK